MNSYCKADKTMKMCATCRYWGGWRQFDGLGTYTFDMDNKDGPCNQVGWKGFGGATVNAYFQCPDYEPQTK